MARCNNKHSQPQAACYVCAVIYYPLALQNNTWRRGPPRPARPPPPPGAAPAAARPPEGALLGIRLIIPHPPTRHPTPPLINTGGGCRGPPLHPRPRGRGLASPPGGQGWRQGSRQRSRQGGCSEPGQALPQPGERRERRGDPAPQAPHHLLEPMLKTHSAVRPDTAFLPEKNHC